MKYNEDDRTVAVSVEPAVHKTAEPERMTGQVQETESLPYADEEIQKMNLNILQNNLMNCLRIIDDEVMKGYITKLNQLPVRPFQEDADAEEMQFFKISEMVYQEDEFAVDKLATVFQALSNKPCTLALMLKSDGKKTEFYLGVRSEKENSVGTLRQMLENTLLGAFPGSRVTKYYDEDIKKDMQSVKKSCRCISGVTCVADYKQEQDTISNREFVQGLEKFVYAMQGRCYTAVMIADNLAHDELMERKREYERIYTQLSPFANMQMSFTVSDGNSTSMGKSEGTALNRGYTKTKGTSVNETGTETHTEGSSETTGETDTESDTHTDTESRADGTTHTKGTSDSVSNTVTDSETTTKGISLFGVSASKSSTHSETSGTTHTRTVSDSISKTLTHGFSDARGKSHSDSSTFGTNESDSTSRSVGIGTNESDSYTAGETFNLVNTSTMTDTFGSSKGVTLNAQNMTLHLTLQKIQKHLERIEECESFGMWNFAAYFLGESAAETETAANVYKSVMAGTNSGIERNAVNSWHDEDKIGKILPYIQHIMHPQFDYQGFSYDEERTLTVNPSALVSTKELAIHMGLPRRSVVGLPVVEHAIFAREVVADKPFGEKVIPLGEVYHFGEETKIPISLDLNSLAMHTFVTGSTGAGKSNAVYHLLDEARKQDVAFLVIEPAKGEYRHVFKNIKCFGTNPKEGDILRINPFSFPDKVHVLEHIDRIVEIFNVCWPMYAAMPAVLKDSIERAYISAGWDLDLSENTKIDHLFPTFDDVLRELSAVIGSSDYSADTKGDYIGSLSTRIKSLTNGINGRIFVSHEMELEKLFDENAIIDISRVGSMETKALIMGLVVLKLQEYRMAKADGMNVPLKHLTVLEEAHNLLKKTSTEQSAESSNMIGKSVEMLTNAIAEIRTYGEGFIIVDQAPNLLDTAAIRNTNTKIVLRLPESMDREITGGAMALKEQQYQELSKLPTGVAAVYQNDWQEAVLCALPRYQNEDFSLETDGTKPENAIETRRKQNFELLHLLLERKLPDDNNCRKIEEKIIKADVSAKIRKDLILNIREKNKTYEWAMADFIQKSFAPHDVFRGTGTGVKSLEQLSDIVRHNIEEEFAEFNEQELYSIMYYICRSEHEKHPDNKTIELLRTEYLKEKVM